MKDYVKDKFGINVILPKEAIKHMEELEKNDNKPDYVG